MNHTEALREAQTASSPFAIYWAVMEAMGERHNNPMPDAWPVFAVTDSGGNTTKVTAGQIRKMLDAIFQCSDGPSPNLEAIAKSKNICGND